MKHNIFTVTSQGFFGYYNVFITMNKDLVPTVLGKLKNAELKIFKILCRPFLTASVTIKRK